MIKYYHSIMLTEPPSLAFCSLEIPITLAPNSFNPANGMCAIFFICYDCIKDDKALAKAKGSMITDRLNIVWALSLTPRQIKAGAISAFSLESMMRSVSWVMAGGGCFLVLGRSQTSGN